MPTAELARMLAIVRFMNPVYLVPLTTPFVLASARMANVSGKPLALSADPTAGKVVNEMIPDRSADTVSPHL